MKRALRIAGLVLAALVLAALALLGGAVWLGERKLAREVLVKVVPVPFASGPAAIKQGAYLYESRGCVSCHGASGAGKVMADEGGMYVRTPNLTAGENSAVAGYTEADWVRAIRHGVSPKGRAFFIMPSEVYHQGLNDTDLAALVAYLRSLPPARGEPAVVRLPIIVRALYGLGVIRDASEKIPHGRPPAAPVAAAVTAEHGGYVAQLCKGCHGETLAGGRRPDSPPHGPEPANLTPGAGSVMPRYDTLDKFAAMMKSGQRPDGSKVDMPFDALSAMNATDVAALYAYLKALPPRATGS